MDINANNNRFKRYVNDLIGHYHNVKPVILHTTGLFYIISWLNYKINIELSNETVTFVTFRPTGNTGILYTFDNQEELYDIIDYIVITARPKFNS